MRTVWKYPMTSNLLMIGMPKGAQVIDVAEQDGEVALWAIVDPGAPLEFRTFKVVGTGHREIEESDRYVGTAHQVQGFLVLHVFETQP